MKELIKALQILNKYDNPSSPTHCEHDVLWVMVDPDIVSAGDKALLDEMGFFAEDGCFKSFKYGSA